jgi:hypothetical protein
VQQAADQMIMDGVNIQLPNQDSSQSAGKSNPVEQYAEGDEAAIDGAVWEVDEVEQVSRPSTVKGDQVEAGVSSPYRFIERQI